MRIGELLLQHRWVEWEPLALALTDHEGTGIRLVSYLVARGEVDFDDASRALGQQLGVAAALRRHLERRDPAVAQLVPAVLARKLVALPLGRLSSGTLVVCVRDPSETVRDILTRAVGGEVGLAVAPAKYLERLVASAYPPGASGELEIPVELDEPEEPVDLSFELLDDAEPEDAAYDFAIDIEMPAEPQRPVSTSKPLPVEIKAPAISAAPARDPLDATLAACKDIDELPWLLDTVMEYVGKRWTSSLLFEVRERRAVGVRGHGARLGAVAIRTFVVALDEPSLLQYVRTERRFVDRLPEPRGDDDDALATALASSTVAAAPITRDDAVAYVLVVGDPIDKEPEETEFDLGLLVEAFSDALART